MVFLFQVWGDPSKRSLMVRAAEFTPIVGTSIAASDAYFHFKNGNLVAGGIMTAATIISGVTDVLSFTGVGAFTKIGSGALIKGGSKLSMKLIAKEAAEQAVECSVAKLGTETVSKVGKVVMNKVFTEQAEAAIVHGTQEVAEQTTKSLIKTAVVEAVEKTAAKTSAKEIVETGTEAAATTLAEKVVEHAQKKAAATAAASASKELTVREAKTLATKAATTIADGTVSLARQNAVLHAKAKVFEGLKAIFPKTVDAELVKFSDLVSKHMDDFVLNQLDVYPATAIPRLYHEVCKKAVEKIVKTASQSGVSLNEAKITALQTILKATPRQMQHFTTSAAKIMQKASDEVLEEAAAPSILRIFALPGSLSVRQKVAGAIARRVGSKEAFFSDVGEAGTRLALRLENAAVRGRPGIIPRLAYAIDFVPSVVSDLIKGTAAYLCHWGSKALNPFTPGASKIGDAVFLSKDFLGRKASAYWSAIKQPKYLITRGVAINAGKRLAESSIRSEHISQLAQASPIQEKSVGKAKNLLLSALSSAKKIEDKEARKSIQHAAEASMNDLGPIMGKMDDALAAVDPSKPETLAQMGRVENEFRAIQLQGRLIWMKASMLAHPGGESAYRVPLGIIEQNISVISVVQKAISKGKSPRAGALNGIEKQATDIQNKYFRKKPKSN